MSTTARISFCKYSSQFNIYININKHRHNDIMTEQFLLLQITCSLVSSFEKYRILFHEITMYDVKKELS